MRSAFTSIRAILRKESFATVFRLFMRGKNAARLYLWARPRSQIALSSPKQLENGLHKKLMEQKKKYLTCSKMLQSKRKRRCPTTCLETIKVKMKSKEVSPCGWSTWPQRTMGIRKRPLLIQNFPMFRLNRSFTAKHLSRNCKNTDSIQYLHREHKRAIQSKRCTKLLHMLPTRNAESYSAVSTRKVWPSATGTTRVIRQVIRSNSSLTRETWWSIPDANNAHSVSRRAMGRRRKSARQLWEKASFATLTRSWITKRTV